MKKIKTKIIKSAKKGIAKQIGKQIKNLLEKKFDSVDPQAADFAQKYGECLAMRAMGEKISGKKIPGAEKSTPEISTKNDKTFKIKITGMNKVAKDIMNGKNAEKSFKENAGIFASFSFKW